MASWNVGAPAGPVGAFGEAEASAAVAASVEMARFTRTARRDVPRLRLGTERWEGIHEPTMRDDVAASELPEALAAFPRACVAAPGAASP
jgi:hypothetical protein